MLIAISTAGLKRDSRDSLSEQTVVRVRFVVHGGSVCIVPGSAPCAIDDISSLYETIRSPRSKVGETRCSQHKTHGPPHTAGRTAPAQGSHRARAGPAQRPHIVRTPHSQHTHSTSTAHAQRTQSTGTTHAQPAAQHAAQPIAKHVRR